MSKFSITISLLIILLGLTSCAYVNYNRQYEVTGLQNIEEEKHLVDFFNTYFEEKGLVIKGHYKISSTSGTQATNLNYELPRDAEEKRRDPILRIIIENLKSVSIIHDEWFLSVNPVPSMEPYKPADYIESIREDLTKRMESHFESPVKINFVKKSYY